MGSSQCEGIVRIRRRVTFHSSSCEYELDDREDDVLLSPSAICRFQSTISRLSDDVWYFCVSRSPVASLAWFPLDTCTGGIDEVNNSPCVVLRGNSIASMRVTSVEAVDGENVKLPENAHESGMLVDWSPDEQARKHFESVLFYVEDKSLGVALLVEAKSHNQRDEWVMFLSNVLLHSDVKEISCDHDSDNKSQTEESVGKEFEVQSASTTSLKSTRSLLHQGKSETLLDDDDPFGLLLFTTSAFSSVNELDLAGRTEHYAARGVFAMDHIELTEELGHENDSEDEGDSDTNSLISDLDYAADLVYNPTLLPATQRQQLCDRKRSSSHGTTSLSSCLVRNGGAITSSRRHSADSMSSSATRSCSRCSKTFGRLFHTPKVCASCSQHFCRSHCNQWTTLTTLDSITLPNTVGPCVGAKSVSASEAKRVCMDCYVRQQLLTFLHEMSVYYTSAIDEAGGLTRLVRWKYFDQGPKHEFERHVRARNLGPLSILSAMFKYRQQPFMFVVVLAQLVHKVENCIDTMDFYWPQYLQWGLSNLPDASPSVRAFYLFFLAATARRSVHLAVKATWECIAAHWDAMTGGFFERGHGIVVMLFFITNVNFGEPRSVLPRLLFPQAPVHQRETFTKLLDHLFEIVRKTHAASQRESPFFEWLLARSKEETVASSRHVQKQLRIGDGFLDPFPSGNFEDLQLIIMERRNSRSQHLVETKQRLWNTSALHSFSDEIRLVRFLVDLCTYLKENIAEPSLRKKHLPALLQELLHGKHIRPDAALPLSGAINYSHRVVNVLTDEGTVFSTKARAPTLVFFEVIASSFGVGKSCEFDVWSNHSSEANALADAAVMTGREKGGCVLELEQQEILNYLDGERVGTYVADLIPSSRDDSQNSIGSSVSESLTGLSHIFPAGYSSLSIYASESDSYGAEGRSEENGLDTRNTADFTNTKQEAKCPFFGERFADKQKRICEKSRFSRFDGWALVPVIAKSFDDMRQEVFVLQGLKLFQLIFRKHNLNLWLRFYNIVCAGKDCGLLEVITDAQSLDGLKKKGREITGIGSSLPKIFEQACGRDPTSGHHDPVRLERARANFISSMAAYSLFSYVFLVKDRHNGNIMLDTEGHVVHIDFGFVLGIAPGNTFSLETAPFKLTPEMVDVMGADGFDRYRQFIAQGLLALHLEAQQLMSLVYLSSKDSCFPCFKGQSRARVVRRLRRRLCVGWSVQDVERTATRIVDKSYGHRGTRQYDWFQNISNGILP